MKTMLLFPVFLFISITIQTLIPKAFNIDLSHVKPYHGEGFNPKAFLAYHFMSPSSNINIHEIVEYLPAPEPRQVPVIRYVAEILPETTETAVPVVDDETSGCAENPVIILKTQNHETPQPVIDTDKLLQMRMRQLRTPSPDLFDWMCYEFDTALENQPASDMAATSPENQPDPSYDFNTDYDNKANRGKSPDKKMTRNMAGKNDTFKPSDNENFVVPENRMIKITGAENEYPVGVNVTYDFQRYEGATDALYCLNVKRYPASDFEISNNLDLTEADDFDCAESEWKTYEEIEREIYIPWSEVAVMNIKAKTTDGAEFIYQRLYLRHYLEFVDYPITCDDFITYLYIAHWMVLNQDIDCSGYNLAVVQTYETANLHFIGNGHKISNISVANTLYAPTGVLGGLSGGAYISNLGFENINISSTSSRTGGILGELNDSALENVFITGATVSGTDIVGGMVGSLNAGALRQCKSEAVVDGLNDVGGLVGSSEAGSEILNSSSSGTVLGVNIHIGGLVGLNLASLIDKSSSEAEVEGSNNVGGLVGTNFNGAQILYSSSSGTVHGVDPNQLIGYGIGGLVGTNLASSVKYSSSSSDVNSEDEVFNTGGLIGYSNEYSTVEYSSASGAVSSAYHNVGGLIGTLYSEDYNTPVSLNHCFATGSVSGGTNVGGLVGKADYVVINNVYAKGTVYSMNTNSQGYAGGLIGTMNNSELYNAYALGDIEACTASTTYCSMTGGLVGELSGSIHDPIIENSYAMGNVIGTERTGSLVGSLAGNATFINGYATGTISGTGQYVGGVFGYRNANAVVTGVYTLYPDSSPGVTVLSQEQFGLQASFVGFDFTNIWEMQSPMMCGDIRRPHLYWEPDFDLRKACRQAIHTPQK